MYGDYPRREANETNDRLRTAVTELGDLLGTGLKNEIVVMLARGAYTKLVAHAERYMINTSSADGRAIRSVINRAVSEGELSFNGVVFRRMRAVDEPDEVIEGDCVEVMDVPRTRDDLDVVDEVTNWTEAVDAGVVDYD